MLKKTISILQTIWKNEHKKEDKNLSKKFFIVSQNDASKGDLKTGLNNKIEQQIQSINKSKFIAVFESFFDLLTFQTMNQNKQQPLTNLPDRQTGFLVLNSLSFFERSLLLMEKHEHIHLYLDHDDAGRRCAELVFKRSTKYEHKSSLYKSYKDLNDWLVHDGKLKKSETLKQVKRKRSL